MTTFEQKLQEWFISETHLLSERHLKHFPEPSVFCRLFEGKNKKIWKYVIEHVRHRCTADKVRRVLAVKKFHQELENPYSLNEKNQVINRILKSKEKRTFIEGSLPEIEEEIGAAENEVKMLSNEICIINQKSAVLELIATDYKLKLAELKSVKSSLMLHLKSNSRDGKFHLSLDLLPSSIVCSNKLAFGGEDKDHDKVKFILKQMMSSIMKASEACEMSESMTDNLNKNVHQLIKTYSIGDLFNILRELSNKSYIELMSKESYSTEFPSTQSSEQNSIKYLQDMKLAFFQSSFNTKKTKNEIKRLQEVKNIILKKFVKNDNAETEKKFRLLEEIAENAGHNECIKFLENALKIEHSKAELLTKSISEMDKNSNSIKLVVRNFYSTFDTFCTLLKSGPDMHECILKSLTNLYKFANESMFSPMNSTLKDYPFQWEDCLKSDIQTMWTVMKRSNILRPLLPYLFSVRTAVPDTLIHMLNISKYQSEHVICYLVKNLKERIAQDQYSEFKPDDTFPHIGQQHVFMTEKFQTMRNQIELWRENFQEGLEQSQRTQTVLNDWWNQGAQFIPQIEYEGKSLKMWLDLLLVLPDL